MNLILEPVELCGEHIKKLARECVEDECVMCLARRQAFEDAVQIVLRHCRPKDNAVSIIAVNDAFAELEARAKGESA